MFDFNAIPFKNRKSLLQHYRKHGDEMSADSPEDYLNRANLVRDYGIPGQAKQGKVSMEHPGTGERIIIDPLTKKILTYYIRRALLRGNK